MQTFELTILGSSSATPTSNRHPTAQLLNIAERFFLIDCGEGTQMQLRKYRIKFQRIDHILISHLHGDHYLGLIGLLQSMHLLGRERELHLYCPKELKEIIEIQNKYSQTYLSYPIHYHFTNDEKAEIIFEDEKLSVETIILNHRIPCTGFLFREKPRDLKILPEELAKHKVSVAQIHRLKKGMNAINDEGTEIDFRKLTTEPVPPRSYAFCSDTIYTENFVDQIRGVNVLYHEATFLHSLLDRAKITHHTTALQAGELAKKAEVGKLLLGHFSARYNHLEDHAEEARKAFAESHIANEGQKFVI